MTLYEWAYSKHYMQGYICIYKQMCEYTSDLVAPPTINTKIRWPIFLGSLDECLRTESLQEIKERSDCESADAGKHITK